MNLILEYYTPSNEHRDKEYLSCIRENITSKFFKSINIFVEEGSKLPDDISSKVNIYNGKRNTFQDLFNYCNTNFQGEVCFIINTDIFFDATIKYINTNNLKDKFMALTRWDILKDGKARFFDNSSNIAYFSQDVWGFVSPISIDDANFYLGKPGCDNKISYLANKAGLSPRNPSLGIKAYHLHLTGYRTYIPGGKDTVPGPYLGIKPTENINRDTQYARLGDQRG